MQKLNLGFLCSHSGSNMQAIIDNVKNGNLYAELCAVVSNNHCSGAIEKAQKENIPHYVVNEKTHTNEITQEIIRIFKSHNVDTVILAGYMKLISQSLIDAFNNRVLNIHPALLPKFGGKGMYGMNVHKAVIEAKEIVSGATIHQVNPNYDDGKILAQIEVPVLPNDTPEILAERILKEEHKLYSSTLIKISNGEIIL
jgi:phosphoribosylglycinamide formyltransferase-1